MHKIENHYKKKGTVFFIVVILLMLLNLIMYSSLRSISYMVSLAKEREKSEQTYYLAYSLYCFIANNYNIQPNKESKAKTMIFMGPWPNKESKYKGLAWIEQRNKIKTLFIQLDKNQKKLIVLSFLL